MGKKHKKKNYERKNKFFSTGSRKEKENDQQSSERRHPAYIDIVRENADFETYYKMQNICSEEEFKLMMECLKQDLPSAFRITGCSKSESRLLLSIVESQLFKDLLNSDSQDEDNSRKPFCLPWYPNRLGWQIQITRKDIRRSEAFFKLHNFLIAETGSGSISRQEVVSMIPPLLLDIQSHHKVLDMCAAPGSKTAQLIELLHQEERSIPDGFVIANDVDNSRCYMLVHQAKRLNSPNMMIVNHDASNMPNFFVSDKDGNRSVLKFDRILCDVPCTGDGTLRKNPDIWLKWNAANGNNLHGLQFRILRRGLEMLNIGGRIVYSTCSLNPIENEAVIHRILSEMKGAVELVDGSKSVPGLKFLPGVSHWTPASKDNIGYTNFDEVPVKYHTQVRPNMFPPKPEEASQFHLNKCLRILPHLQDTGGFFVAVLEKKALLPFEMRPKFTSTNSIKKEERVSDTADNNSHHLSTEEKVDPENNVNVSEVKEEKVELENNKIASEVEACSLNVKDLDAGQDDEARDSNFEPQRKRKRIVGYREDPFVFFEDDEPVWTSIRDFYDMSSDLPQNCLLTRCLTGKKKNVYFTSPAIKNLVDNNHSRIKIINTGVKTFVRCDYKKVCDFRLSQEGLPSIEPFIGAKRRIRIVKSDLLAMLECDPKSPPEFATLDPATQENVKDVDVGCCLLEYRSDNLNLDLTGWRGKCSLKVYIPSSDVVHYIRLLGGDISKYNINKFKKEAIEMDAPSNGTALVKEESMVPSNETDLVKKEAVAPMDKTVSVKMESMETSDATKLVKEEPVAPLDKPDVVNVKEESTAPSYKNDLLKEESMEMEVEEN